MTQKQFERLLYQHAGADRKTAEELAHHLYFHNRRRWLFEWGKAWVHQVGEEADKMEGITTNAPSATQDIGYRGPEEVAHVDKFYTTENSPPRAPGSMKKYFVKGFWWWDRYCQSKQEPQ